MKLLSTTMSTVRFLFVLASSCILLLGVLPRQLTVSAQDYNDYAADDYAQDTLYHDYAARQDKAVNQGGGGGMTKMFLGGTVGWFLGAKFHSGRLKKKLEAKHKEEQKAIYTQYYNDVYTLQAQNAELAQALEQYGMRMR